SDQAMMIDFYNSVRNLQFIFAHAHGGRCAGFQMKVDQLAEIDLCQQISVHDDQRLVRQGGDQAEGAGGSKTLVFMQIMDLNSPPRAVAEIILNHFRLVIDGYVKPSKAAGDEIVHNDFQNWLG